MPRNADGSITRSRFTSLKLRELSSVDNPAQPGALALIMKRDDSKPAPSLLAVAVAKYVDEEDGAHTFAEVLQANEFDERIWPMVSALSQAIRSIMGDTSIKQPDREAKVTQSVDEFLAAVRDLSPAAEKKLAELISKRNPTMKTVAELIAENPALKSHIEGIEAERETAKGALTTEQTAHGETKKALAAATDEVIKVDGNDVKKSAVGDASFSVFKSLSNRAELAELTKRAGDEYGHVVGKAEDKALVLKVAAGMDEPTRKAFDAIMTSAEQMAKGAFGRLGGGGGLDDISADTEKAVATFDGKVSEIAKRDGINPAAAMSKARREFPAEFKAAYPEQAE